LDIEASASPLLQLFFALDVSSMLRSQRGITVSW